MEARHRAHREPDLRDPSAQRGHPAPEYDRCRLHLDAALDAAATGVLGRPLEPVGLNAWADSGLMQGAGIPTLMFGPLGANFHAPDEWTSIGETVQAVAIVEGAIRRYLG